MKNIYFFVFLAVMLVACQPKSKPVDLATSKSEVNSLLEKYLHAWNSRDVNTLSILLTEDGLFCGTDPTEFFDKKIVVSGWTQAFSDTANHFSYSVEKREIRVTSDGNSAIAVEQYTMKEFMPKIQWRLVNHLVKTSDGWKFDFISWNLIPKNEDIPKLNKALE